jgi:hypothetical protein
MPCPRCPVPDGSECIGFLCHLAGDPAWDRHILGRSALPIPVPPPAPPSVPLAAYHDRRDLARACPYRWDDQIDSGCGCHEPRVCLMGKGRENFHLGRDAIVTLQECLACVAAP